MLPGILHTLLGQRSIRHTVIPLTTVDIKNRRSAKKSDKKMLKAGDLARWEGHRVRGSKGGEPDEIWGYHMYDVKWKPHKIGGDHPDMTIAVYSDVNQHQNK